MLAVVQIGSSTRRSACITARIVRAGPGCACVLMMDGALVSAAAASPPFNTFRRVVIAVPPVTLVLVLHKLGHGNARRTSFTGSAWVPLGHRVARSGAVLCAKATSCSRAAAGHRLRRRAPVRRSARTTH